MMWLSDYLPICRSFFVKVSIARRAAVVLWWFANNLAARLCPGQLLILRPLHRYVWRSLLRLIDEVARGVGGIEVFDDALELGGVLRLSDVHRIVSVDYLLCLAGQSFAG